MNGWQGQDLIRQSFLKPCEKSRSTGSSAILRGTDECVPVQRWSSKRVSCGADRILMLIPLQCAAPFVPSHTLLCAWQAGSGFLFFPFFSFVLCHIVAPSRTLKHILFDLDKAESTLDYRECLLHPWQIGNNVITSRCWCCSWPVEGICPIKYFGPQVFWGCYQWIGVSHIKTAVFIGEGL